MLTAIKQSVTLKVFGIGFLALLMLIPLAQVRGLIAERNGMRDQALHTIAQRWGAAQQVGGPLLAIPLRTRMLINGNWTAATESTEILLADQLVYAGKLQSPEIRHYGIYSTPVYMAELKISGRFLASDIRTLVAHARAASSDTSETIYALEAAELRLPLADVRGIRRISALRVDGKEYTFGPGAHSDGALQGAALPLDLSHWATDETHAFELELTLAVPQACNSCRSRVRPRRASQRHGRIQASSVRFCQRNTSWMRRDSMRTGRCLISIAVMASTGRKTAHIVSVRRTRRSASTCISLRICISATNARASTACCSSR